MLAQSYQNMEADGVFAEMAANALGEPQPDLSVQLFNPSYNKDRFENTALTINGHVRPLELLYAGSYLVRNVEQHQDYTANYARRLLRRLLPVRQLQRKPLHRGPRCAMLHPELELARPAAQHASEPRAARDDTGGCTSARGRRPVL